ncbi:hypothetical protein AMTRI_Chr05g60040 [Amborella trichopoda]
MGGIGKTTLMKNVNNRLGSSSCFDTVIWVTVSNNPDVASMQKKIGDRLGLDISKAADIGSEPLKVLRNKRFLLILDDVWKRFELKTLGIPRPTVGNKSKVILTTRYAHVCSDMEADRSIEVKKLPEAEARSLFRKKAGPLVASESIESLAETILKRCYGLPLSIVTVARAMANKKEVAEWEDAIAEMNLSAPNLRGMVEDVFIPLKFREGLLDRQGTRDRPATLHAARNKACTLARSLKAAGMLEDGDDGKTWKLHDVLRDLALWITSTKSVEGLMFIVKAPEAAEWQEAERISLRDKNVEELPELSECTKLRTLLLRLNLRVLCLAHCEGLEEELPPEIGELGKLQRLTVFGCPRLAVLFTCGMVQHLKNLTSMHISEACIFQKALIEDEEVGENVLPNLTSLELEFLPNLFSSPVEWCNTLKISLVCIFQKALIEDEEVGENVLPNLTSLELEFLPNLVSLCGDHDLNLQSLERLTVFGCPRLAVLFTCGMKPLIEDEEVGENVLPNLTSLELEFLPNLVSLCGDHDLNLQSLERLTVFGCPRLAVLFTYGMNVLPNLTSLELEFLPNLVSLCGDHDLNLQLLERLTVFGCPRLAVLFTCGLVQLLKNLTKFLPNLVSLCGDHDLSLQSLERLTVFGCPRLAVLFTCGMVQHLKNLTSMHISDCVGMNALIEDEEVGENVLPNLTSLELEILPNLVSLCGDHDLNLQSLKRLTVFKCQRLAVLFTSGMAQHLKILTDILYSVEAPNNQNVCTFKECREIWFQYWKSL